MTKLNFQKLIEGVMEIRKESEEKGKIAESEKENLKKAEENANKPAASEADKKAFKDAEEKAKKAEKDAEAAKEKVKDEDEKAIALLEQAESDKRINLVKAVTNPLNMIALFATSTEVLATIALLNTTLEVQKMFMGFLFVYPVLLVVGFFIVLYTKYYAFYSPADYPNHDDFLQILIRTKIIAKQVIEMEKEGGSAQKLLKETKGLTEEVFEIGKRKNIISFQNDLKSLEESIGELESAIKK
jgi:predicted  nucleic acid-binding Zn-ribbon protein